MKNKTLYNQIPQPHYRTLGDVCSNLPLFPILYPEQKLQNKTNRIGFKVAAFLAPYMKSLDTHAKNLAVSLKALNYFMNVFSF